MHDYFLPLQKKFIAQADAANALLTKAYLRNQFDTYGLATPLRRRLTVEHLKKKLPEYSTLDAIVKSLWSQPEREWQYVAVELLAGMKKQWQPDLIDLIEFMIVNKSWWDSVDHIASELTGDYFQRHPEKIKTITGRWNRDKNIWLQRSSIMFQKKYRNKTDTAMLSRYIVKHASSKEFFIQKAIGWSLREYSKTDPRWVHDFVKKNNLSPLSAREAVKRIKK